MEALVFSLIMVIILVVLAMIKSGDASRLLGNTNEYLRGFNKESIMESVIRNELHDIMQKLSNKIYLTTKTTNIDLITELRQLNMNNDYYLDKDYINDCDEWDQLLAMMLFRKVQCKLSSVSSKYNITEDDVKYIYKTMIDRINYMEYFNEYNIAEESVPAHNEIKQKKTNSAVDRSLLNKQFNSDEPNNKNEHVFTIKCNSCGLKNEMKSKSIYYFPYCMSCKELMFDIRDNTHRESIMKYVIENKQNINGDVYNKIRTILTA